MSILSELRLKASEKKDAEELKATHEQYLDNTYKYALLPKMQQIFTYLNEIVKHLNFVAEPILIKDYSQRYPQFGDLMQQGYRINTDGYGGLADYNRLMQINLTFTLSGDGFFTYDIEGKRIIEQEVAFLHSRNMPFQWKNIPGKPGIKAASFTIMRKIPVRFRIEVLYDKAQLLLIIDNHEDFAVFNKIISPEAVTDGFLEDMISYLLRRNHNFTRLEISEQHKQKIRDELEALERERAALLAQIRHEEQMKIQKQR